MELMSSSTFQGSAPAAASGAASAAGACCRAPAAVRASLPSCAAISRSSFWYWPSFARSAT
eukprot:8156255-Lingulodinium_polyedra.AAC.1